MEGECCTGLRENAVLGSQLHGDDRKLSFEEDSIFSWVFE